MKKIKLSQIGLGRWGPNLFRNFVEDPMVEVISACDLNPEKEAKIKRFNIPFTKNIDDILKPGNNIDAVVISTPLSTHFKLAKQALECGKHIFIEKPITETIDEARQLVNLAKKNKLILMVGHVFLYNAGIRYVKNLIDTGEIGNIMFVHGERTNLGPIRQDTNSLWDLASHDISIFNYWLNTNPVSVCASGSNILSKTQEDVVSANFYYPGNICCHTLASWLHPRKVREITVVGDKKMVVWDDISANEPVRIYDKSVRKTEPKEQMEGTLSEFNFLIQEGDVHIPKIPRSEPLKTECSHFIDCLLNNRQPMTDGLNGLEVIAALEAATKSLKNNSRSEKIIL